MKCQHCYDEIQRATREEEGDEAWVSVKGHRGQCGPGIWHQPLPEVDDGQ